jgi:hypothetical protein
MPASDFAEYHSFISHLLDGLLASAQARLLEFQVDQRSMSRGLISGILLFPDDSALHFKEYVDVTQAEPRVMYAYHYQDAEGRLIFRYDNARHRPPLS